MWLHFFKTFFLFISFFPFRGGSDRKGGYGGGNGKCCFDLLSITIMIITIHSRRGRVPIRITLISMTTTFCVSNAPHRYNGTFVTIVTLFTFTYILISIFAFFVVTLTIYTITSIQPTTSTTAPSTGSSVVCSHGDIMSEIRVRVRARVSYNALNSISMRTRDWLCCHRGDSGSVKSEQVTVCIVASS